MNFTFVIGNGFDINLGLKTKYTDFYEYIERNNLLEDNMFFEKIRENVEYWEDFEKMLGIMTCFHKDITIFKNRINNCGFNISVAESEKLAKHLIGDGTEKVTWIKYNQDLKNFYTEFKKYLESEESRVEILENETSRKINNSLLYFWKDFEEEEQKKFFESIQRSLDTQIWNGNDKILDLTFEFLNFNYSSTLENMLNCINLEMLEMTWIKLLKSKLNVSYNIKLTIKTNHYHVHANKDSGMFLGVDNVSQLYEDFFPDIDMMDTIIKPYKIDDYIDGNTDKYRNILEKSDYVYIFGMSIGITDLTWWKICIELILKNSAIIVIHYFENDFRIHVSDYEYTTNKDKIRRMLLMYDDTFDKIVDRRARRKIKNGVIPISNSQIMFK